VFLETTSFLTKSYNQFATEFFSLARHLHLNKTTALKVASTQLIGAGTEEAWAMTQAAW
jgi:hypothetical protein